MCVCVFLLATYIIAGFDFAENGNPTKKNFFFLEMRSAFYFDRTINVINAWDIYAYTVEGKGDKNTPN